MRTTTDTRSRGSLGLRRLALIGALMPLSALLPVGNASADDAVSLGWSADLNMVGCGTTMSLVQASDPTSTASYGTTTGGELTSWTTSVSSPSTDTRALEVWRPSGGPGTYQLISRSAAQPMDFAGSRTFSLTSPQEMAAGDRLGFHNVGYGSRCAAGDSARINYVTGTPALGSVVSFPATGGYRLNVSAMLRTTPQDATPPVITSSVNPTAPDGTDGWYTSSPSLTWDISEPESPASLQKTGCADQSVTSDQAEQTYTCSASSTGGQAGPVSVTIKRDATPPVVSGADDSDRTWRNTSLTRSYSSSDATSGLLDSGDAAFELTASAESVDSDTPTSVSRTVTDKAGNTSTRSLGALIDRTPPSVGLVGGPADGSTVWTTQTAPTCAGADALSGLASCTITGFSASVGDHVVTATTTDNAGNTNSESHRYTVRDMTSTGFYSPVDMGGVYNLVKGGSTVPLKFNILVDGVQQTATSAVTRFTASPTSCNASAATDDIEMVTTGGTALRYDSTAGQFIQNWKTPLAAAGTCYRATATLSDLETISALFKMK